MSTPSDILSREAAEQRIMEVLYPPAGLIPNSREERAKVPRIMEAIDHLFAVVNGEELVKVYRGSEESRAITERALQLKKQGKTEADIASILGLTLSAVHNRIGRALYGPQRSQTANSPGAPASPEGPSSPGSAPQDVKTPADVSISYHQENDPDPSIVDALNGDPESKDDGRTATNLPETPTPAEPRSAAEVTTETEKEVISEATADVNVHERSSAEAQPEIEQVPGRAAALQEEPKPAENPIIQESQSAEESEEVRKPKKKPKIPHSEDEYILSERNAGKKFREIYGVLASRGIVCKVDDVVARYYQAKAQKANQNVAEVQKTAENVAEVRQGDTSSRPAKDVVLLQQSSADTPATSDTSAASPAPAESKPAAKAISRAELDTIIWDMHTKEHLTPEEISEKLHADGYYYGEKSIRIRLRNQGARL